jgi:tRNA pseudouridine38-40 synthase
MRRLKLILEYDGAGYHGWQVQPGLPTVQAALQDALGRLAGVPVLVTGAGRTDAGVHAEGQVASCSVNLRLDCAAARRALNAILPRDIVVRQVSEAPADFDARRSARGKTYRYTLLPRPYPSARFRGYSLYVPYDLDLDAMIQAAAAVVGTHDFSAFRAGTCAAASPFRTIQSASWRREDPYWHFEITGTAFLQHMVRILVGTLLEVGRRRRPPAWVGEVLLGRDRCRAGRTVPAHGLCLVGVEY